MSRRKGDRDRPERRDREEGWAVPIDRIAAFTSGAAMAVDVGKIEKELQALWRQAAERAQQAGSGLAVVRASLWNFIVHKRGEQGFGSLKEVLDEVSEAVPTRIIMLLERLGDGEDHHAGQDKLRASIEANTRPGPGGRREVVAEEITLEAPRMEAARLPSLVRSLLLPDLPTALFLSGVAPDAERLGPLLGEADRIVFDSGSIGPGHLRQMARALLPLGTATHPGQSGQALQATEVTDLGWLRAGAWRRLVASLFEDAPEALRAIDDVHIEYAPGAEATALLLAGWLLSRLGWEHVGGDLASGEIALRDGERPVALRLSTGDGAAAPVGVAAVTLRAGGATFCARGVDGGPLLSRPPRAPSSSQSGSILPSAGTPLAVPPAVLMQRPGRPDRTLPVPVRSDAELLVGALGAFGRDPLLLLSLQAALCLIPASAATPTLPPQSARHGGPNLSYS